MVVEAEIFLHQRLRILILDLAMIFHQLTDRTVIYVIAHANLSLHLVAIGNGHVIHLVAEAENQHILCIGPGSADAHPDGDFMLRGGILPITHDNFAADTHTGADVSELAVAMSRLVEVHKVHVHRVPRNFAVELRMQMEERFLELLQSVNPHLRRREGVHPCDDADTLLVVVGSLHDGFHFFGRVGRTLIDYFDGEVAAVVQPLDHFITMSVHGDDRIATVQQLCTCNEPYFELFKTIIHNAILFIDL